MKKVWLLLVIMVISIFSRFIVLEASTQIVPKAKTNPVTSLDQVDLSSFWKYVDTISSWTMSKDGVSAQGLKVDTTYSLTNKRDISLSFTAGLAGDYLIKFTLDNVVLNKANDTGYNYIFTTKGYTLVYDWSDIALKATCVASMKGNTFTFTVLSKSVAQGKQVVLDPSLVAQLQSSPPKGLTESTMTRIFYAHGLHWFFYYASSSNITYYKYSTDGITWSSAQTAINCRLFYNDGGQFDVIYDKILDRVHTVFVNYTGALSYQMGIPYSNGSITWYSPTNIQTLDVGYSQQGWPVISLDSSGYPWVGVCVKSVLLQRYDAYAFGDIYNNGSWTSNGYSGVVKIGDLSYDNWLVTPVQLLNRNMYFITSRTTAGLPETTGFLYTNGTGFGGEEAVASPLVYDVYDAVSFGNTVYFAFVNFSPNNIYYKIRTYGTGWGSNTLLWSRSENINFVKLGAVGIMGIISEGSTGFAYKTYLFSSGSWSSEYTFCNLTGYIGPFSSFYESSSNRVGIEYMNNTATPTPPFDVNYAFINAGINDINFTITNMDAGNWLFAESKYYNFTLASNELTNITETNLASVAVGWYDAAGDSISVIATNSSNTWSFSMFNGKDYAAIAVNGNNATHYTGSNTTILWLVMLRANIIDTPDTDFYATFIDNNGNSTGVITAVTDYCNIYSAGGIRTSITNSGNAGIISGGGVFDLYAYNESYSYSSLSFKNLQHIKMLPIIRFPVNVTTGVVVQSYGVKTWVDNATELGQIEMKISVNEAKSDANNQWVNMTVSWYDKVGIISGIANKTDIIYAYQNVNGTTGTVELQLWIDLWLSQDNSSSTISGRVNAYYYPMISNANPWLSWLTGTNWGSDAAKKKQSMFTTNMLNFNNTPLYAKKIILEDIYTRLANNGYSTNTSITSSEYDVFDKTFCTQSILTGIQTPGFQETAMPAMRNTGGIIGLISGALGSFGSWILGGASWALSSFFTSVVSLVSSFVLTTLDSIIQSLTGQIGVATNFISYLSSMLNSIWSIILSIPTYITYIVTFISEIPTFFANYVWTPFWGIVTFIFNPFFGLFTWLASIFGVATAWLAGTTYTNSLGQIYDFTYMATFRFGPFVGGYAVFAIIFIVYYLLAPVLCVAKMSMEPVVAPLRLAYKVLEFVLWVGKFLYDIVAWMISHLIALANALKPTIPIISGGG